MGLVPQLTVILFCLLACASAVVRGCNHHTLQEIIQHLNTLSREKSPCAELLVTDVFADPQGPASGDLCTAATVLHHTAYLRGPQSCPNREGDPLYPSVLRQVFRNLRSMAQSNCPVSELRQTTLKDFLENLKRIMQKRYSKCRR
ncbi:interleukin-4 precursor [Cavia porcellus]|uniref:Interleukin-4 n=1 Tax=Cavia porcellus TaxID=10141 RepID=G0WM66_CAVPO|nr:interleukin-4 precursor [Cavia porcellus]ADM26239.1 interleukin-4 [Cavia porcellus]